jgi:hypothetical protein
MGLSAPGAVRTVRRIEENDAALLGRREEGDAKNPLPSVSEPAVVVRVEGRVEKEAAVVAEPAVETGRNSFAN